MLLLCWRRKEKKEFVIALTNLACTYTSANINLSASDFFPLGGRSPLACVYWIVFIEFVQNKRRRINNEAEP